VRRRIEELRAELGSIAGVGSLVVLDAAGAQEWIRRSYDHLTKHEHEDARDAATRALELDPRPWQAYRCRGEARFRLGDEHGALVDLNDAVARGATEGASFYLRSVVHYRRGEHELALTDARRSVDRYPSAANYWGQLAACLSRTQAYTEAVEAATRATGLDPALAEPWQTLAAVYGKLDRKGDAVAAMTTYVTLQKDPAKAMRGRVQLEELRKELERR
jgi:tetratricopeptide (TPR) repeat protein